MSGKYHGATGLSDSAPGTPSAPRAIPPNTMRGGGHSDTTSVSQDEHGDQGDVVEGLCGRVYGTNVFGLSLYDRPHVPNPRKVSQQATPTATPTAASTLPGTGAAGFETTIRHNPARAIDIPPRPRANSNLGMGNSLSITGFSVPTNHAVRSTTPIISPPPALKTPSELSSNLLLRAQKADVFKELLARFPRSNSHHGLGT